MTAVDPPRNQREHVTLATKPIIGITPTPGTTEMPHGSFYRFAIADVATTAVERAGGVPLVIPQQTGNIDDILSVVDGLIFSGGGDIDPARYGDDSTHEKTGGLDKGRDDLELNLITAAIDRDIPLLCICRGIQVLNAALGGTLIQDVADQFSPEFEHRQQANGIPSFDPGHEVEVVPGTLLEATYGASAGPVNSFHHQGLKDVAPALRVNATAPDGLVEAVDHPGKQWILGVQWHPEMMHRHHDEQLKPFQGLIEAAIRSKAAVTA